MTLNGVVAIILHYFTEFGSFRGALCKSGWRCRCKEFTFATSSPGEFLVITFGLRNSEQISHHNIINMSIWPVKCSHCTFKKFQRVIFNRVFAATAEQVLRAWNWAYFFTDEKLFVGHESVKNSQTDQVGLSFLIRARVGSRISALHLLRTRPFFSKSVLVSVVVFSQPHFRWTWDENQQAALARRCWCRSFFQRSAALLETYSSSSETTHHQHIALVTQSSVCAERHPIAIHQSWRVAGQQSWPKFSGLLYSIYIKHESKVRYGRVATSIRWDTGWMSTKRSERCDSCMA